MTARTKRKTGYAKRLADPRWQKMRLELLQAADWRCTWCRRGADDGVQLECDHGYYAVGEKRKAHEYERETIHVLCRNCHAKATRARASVHARLGAVHPKHLWSVYELLGEALELLLADPAALDGARATRTDGAVVDAVAEQLEELAREKKLLTPQAMRHLASTLRSGGAP